MIISAILSLITRSYAALAKLLAIAFIAHALGAEGQGAFSVALNGAVLGALVGTAGLEISNSYYAVRDSSACRAIIVHSLAATLLMGTLVGSLLYFITAHTAILSQVSSTYRWLMILAVPVHMLFILLSGISVGALRFQLQLVSNIVLYSVFLLGTGAGTFIALTKYMPFAAWIIGNVLASIILISQLLPEAKGQWFSFSMLRQQFRYGAGAYISNLANWLNYRLDLILVASILGVKEAGYYSVATLLAEGLLHLPKSAGASLLAYSGRNAPPGNAPQLFLYRMTLTLGVGLCSAGIILAPTIIQLLFTSEFLPSVSALRILLLGTLALSVTTLVSNHLYGLGQTKMPARAAAISLVITVALDLVLIPGLGIVGAALASLLAYTTSGVVLAVHLLRHFNASGVSWRDLVVIQKSDLHQLVGFVRYLRKGPSKRSIHGTLS